MLIVVDTLRGDSVVDEIGRVGPPNLARLATDGVVFEDAFVHYPVTLPSHTSLFASRLPHTVGVLRNEYPVPSDVPLVTTHLADAGWSTGAVLSLTVLRGRGPGTSLDRGFDFYVSGDHPWRRSDEVWPEVVEALDALEDETPFFLFAHYSDPHEPYHSYSDDRAQIEVRFGGEVLGTPNVAGVGLWQGTVELRPGENHVELVAEVPIYPRTLTFAHRGKRHFARFVEGGYKSPEKLVRAVFTNRSDEPVEGTLTVFASDAPTREVQIERYAGEVAYADRYVGELLDELERRGLYDDALIVFTSDHGEAFGEHDNRHHGWTLFDEEIHVPLIVKLPTGDPRRAELERASQGIVRHVDLVPTLLELLGLPPLDGQQGRSLLRHDDPRPRVLVAQTHVDGSRWCMRDERYKLVYDLEQDSYVMFDLEQDPGELLDRFDELRTERPQWPAQLAAMARSVDLEAGPGEVPAEMQAHLEALGYF